MPKTSSRHNESPAELPANVRTIISLVLFVHLFAVVLAIATNFGPLSELRGGLRVNFLMRYLQLLNMDSAYNFHYMYGDPLDFDQMIEVELGGGESEEARTVQLPESGLGNGLRRRRYEQLAQSVAEQAGNEDTEHILPGAIATHLMSEYDTSELNFRCRTHFGQSSEDAGALDPAQADPFDERYYQTMYEARIWLDDVGELQFLKSETSQSAAPATTAPRPGPRTAPPASRP